MGMGLDQAIKNDSFDRLSSDSFCHAYCVFYVLHSLIAGDFVPGRIRTQENSYPK